MMMIVMFVIIIVIVNSLSPPFISLISTRSLSLSSTLSFTLIPLHSLTFSLSPLHTLTTILSLSLTHKVDLLLRFASKLNKTQVEVEVEVEDKISDDEGSFSSSGPVTKFVRLDSLGSWKSSGKPR